MRKMTITHPANDRQDAERRKCDRRMQLSGWLGNGPHVRVGTDVTLTLAFSANAVVTISTRELEVGRPVPAVSSAGTEGMEFGQFETVAGDVDGSK